MSAVPPLNPARAEPDGPTWTVGEILVCVGVVNGIDGVPHEARAPDAARALCDPCDRELIAVGAC